MATPSEYAKSATVALHQVLRISPSDFDAEGTAAVIDQAIRDATRERVHPDDLAAVEAGSAQLFKKGCYTVECRFLKKDGTYCWVNDAQQLIRDKSGQPFEVVGSWSDVTARKQLGDAPATAQERLRRLGQSCDRVGACAPSAVRMRRLAMRNRSS